MTETFRDTENDLFLNLQLPAVAGKDKQPKYNEQKPRPSFALESLLDSEAFSAGKNIGWRSDLPNESGERFDSDDEVRTKRAVEEYEGYLANRPEPNTDSHPVPMPDLPVQYDNPTAKRLYKLFYQAFIEGDEKQNIKSELYQAENGKIIFCMDARSYNANEEIDSCYSYARYGIGLYVSQHLLYNIYGVQDTDFIADNTQRFYEQFIADIQRYQSSLANNVSAGERAESLNRYARQYLSDVAHNIAEQLTDTFGKQKEFETIEASLKSLDKIVPAASMAFQPIPHVTIDKFEYRDLKIQGLDISQNYDTIIHPTPGKMAEEIKPYWEQTPAIFNFLDTLHPCEQDLFHYIKPAVLAGNVTLPSQYRSKFPGAKNVRKFEQMRVLKDENGQIRLEKIGDITGSSTTLTAFKDAPDHVLVDCNKATLLQQQAMMARGTERGLRLCNISLCSIDFSTALMNKFSEKFTDPLDAKIIRTTYAAAKNAGNKFFTNNEAINFERYIDGLQNAPELVQKLLAELTNYGDLQGMLPYIRHTEGIDENINYIEAFRNEFDGVIEREDLQRLDVYLELMKKVQALHQSGKLDKLEVFLDTIAIFAMLCNVYNELTLKYDADKRYDNIIVPINCASGENRTGAAISHDMVLSRTADVIAQQFGIAEITNLLDEKYYPLRRAIGNHLEQIGLIGRDNESPGSTLGTKGTRDKSEGSISRINVSKKVRKTYVCRPEADFKSFIEDVYIPEKDRIDILRDSKLKKIALGENKGTVDNEKAYRDIIDGYSIFSILYTLRILRAPDALKWLPAVDAELIHTILIEKAEILASKKINLVQDNLGLYLPTIQLKAPVMDLLSSNLPLAQDEKKPSLTTIVLGKLAILVPKIDSIQNNLGLNFFPAQPKSADPITQQENPCHSFPSIQTADCLPQQNEKKSGDEKTQSLPQEHQKRKANSLKMGSIIAGLFVVLAPIIAFVELHGISIFAAVTLAASAMTGWWYAREDESDQKKNSVYGGGKSNQTFFSGQPEPVVSRDPEKHNTLGHS